MFWGVISRTGPVRLVKVTGIVDELEHCGPIKNMNSAMYQNLLVAHLMPCLEENLGAVFQHNDAPIQTSKTMKAFYDRFGLTPPFWPPKSPDQSVIEYC